MEEWIEQSFHYLHDIHNYFGSLRRLALAGNSEAIVKLIDEIEGKLQEVTAGKIYNNNSILNAILAEQNEKAKKQKIDMKIFVENFLYVDFISDADMISMFGNLLDNALDAAGKCEAGERKVEVKLFMGSQYMLVLYINNSYVIPIQRDRNRILTSKDNAQGHGLGIRIVEKLAEKYGGMLNLEDEAGEVHTTLTISAVGRRNV